jgi:Rrf2 family cysteine metabolism transcriptional repressor
MILSTKGRYGLKAMFVLAIEYGKGPVALSMIASKQNISINYLEQLFLPLRKEGLVSSVRGAHGGYMLSHEPHNITVGKILKTLEGPILAAECAVEDDATCNNASYCVTRLIWERITVAVDDVIESITLEDMVKDHQTIIYLTEPEEVKHV